MFPCTAEPWWVFRASAEAMAETWHVFLIMPDGHDGEGTEFESVERSAHDAAAFLRARGIARVDAMYGVSMGGAIVTRFLAAEKIPVEKAIIDAGITPYELPRSLCRLIAARDWACIMLGTRSLRLMKLAMPPARWTPAGEDPEEHYRKVLDFERHSFSSRTAYRVFWSANNYAMPKPVPAVGTEIEYWYGDEEERARREDLARVRAAYPQTVPRKFAGLAHAELVMMFPARFRSEALRFLEG